MRIPTEEKKSLLCQIICEAFRSGLVVQCQVETCIGQLTLERRYNGTIHLHRLSVT
jgi:hypothetical protein